MAETAIQSPASLSKDYLLPSEEKHVQSKSVEVTKEEAPVTAASEDIAGKTTEEALNTPASEESGEVPVAPAIESSEAPASSTETSTEESVQAGESVEKSAPVAEESSEAPEQEESATEEETPDVKLETAPADFRFPTTNQTRHCFTRYIEYHRCVAAKGDDAPECDKFAKFYRSLCPGEWVDRWNEQRENGTFAGPL